MDNEVMELPPGFRFHPTDEELITHYLSQKVLNNRFCARAIGEVDLNRVEPWDLPWRAKMGEKEWYFFCVRDRKYPTGMRTNRATDAGYWKATGKDREIYRKKELVGMKKTLVFYKGRAPRGEKTNWVMHEFRLEGWQVMYRNPKDTKNEWIICRVFQKSLGGKKMHISAILRMRSVGDELQPPTCPSLGESSAHNGQTKSTAGNASDMTSFSDPSENQKPQEDMVESLKTPFLASSSSSINPSDISSVPNSCFSTQVVPSIENFHYPSDPFLMQDQSVLGLLLNNNGPAGPKGNWKTELPIDPGMNNVNSSSAVSNQEMMGRHRPYFDQEELITSGGQVDLGCLWNY